MIDLFRENSRTRRVGREEQLCYEGDTGKIACVFTVSQEP